MSFDALRNAKLIAHRGAASVAPENTLAAFKKAHQMGASWVEFDVMLSQDGVAIIMHDDTLERTTNGAGNVADTDFAELKKLDAGSWFSAEFAGEPIPTFKELLDCLRERNMNMEVEIKPTPGMGKKTAEVTLGILNKYWPMSERPPLMSSWDQDAIATVQTLAPELVVGSVIDTVDELKTAANSQVVSVNEALVTPEFLKHIQERFDIILPYTVNNRARAEELLSMGCTAVFSDYPDLLG